MLYKLLAPLLGLAVLPSASPLSVARQTQVGDWCVGLGGNIIDNLNQELFVRHMGY
jgi:hypothetical protein